MSIQGFNQFKKKFGIDPNGKIERFVKVAATDFLHVAAVFPSSRWATRSVTRHIPADAKVIVEYGPGNGAVTHKILNRLSESARLIGIEVNENFVTQLSAFGDSRLEVIHGNVEDVSAKLREFAENGVDAVISGIPFSFLSSDQRETIVAQTRRGLRDGGRFILYQNSPKMMEYLKPHFKEVKCYFEPRNIFPYFIMVGYV